MRVGIMSFRPFLLSCHQAEARLERLQKDMGLLKHKGEEEEMAEFLLRGKHK